MSSEIASGLPSLINRLTTRFVPGTNRPVASPHHRTLRPLRPILRRRDNEGSAQYNYVPPPVSTAPRSPGPRPDTRPRGRATQLWPPTDRTPAPVIPVAVIPDHDDSVPEPQSPDPVAEHPRAGPQRQQFRRSARRSSVSPMNYTTTRLRPPRVADRTHTLRADDVAMSNVSARYAPRGSHFTPPVTYLTPVVAPLLAIPTMIPAWNICQLAVPCAAPHYRAATPGQMMQLTLGTSTFPGSEPYLGTTPQAWPPDRRLAPIHLAPWMIPNPNDADTPIIQWDIRRDPMHAVRVTGRNLSRPLRDEPHIWNANIVWPDRAAAAVDAVGNVRQAHNACARIPVRRGDGVRTRDLFYAIYDLFHQRMTVADVERHCAQDPDARARLDAAFHARIALGDGLYAHNWEQGYKRVDMLGDETHWFGAWVDMASRPGEWHLEFGLIRR